MTSPEPSPEMRCFLCDTLLKRAGEPECCTPALLVELTVRPSIMGSVERPYIERRALVTSPRVEDKTRDRYGVDSHRTFAKEQACFVSTVALMCARSGICGADWYRMTDLQAMEGRAIRDLLETANIPFDKMIWELARPLREGANARRTRKTEWRQEQRAAKAEAARAWLAGQPAPPAAE